MRDFLSLLMDWTLSEALASLAPDPKLTPTEQTGRLPTSEWPRPSSPSWNEARAAEPYTNVSFNRTLSLSHGVFIDEPPLSSLHLCQNLSGSLGAQRVTTCLSSKVPKQAVGTSSENEVWRTACV